MKSIYSLDIMQRIADHFSIGHITYVTYFSNIGRMTWRHFIETNQGEFELYSYPTELTEYAQQRITDSPTGDRGKLFPTLCHSFDRYHQLRQLNQKLPITSKQLATNMVHLEGQTLTKIFRVYGGIVQMYFADRTVFASYGRWNLQHTLAGKPSRVVIDSSMNSYEEIDDALASLPAKELRYQSFILKGSWFELYFSEGYSLHFVAYEHLPAAELNFPQQRKEVRVMSEREVAYIKEF